MKKKKPKKQTQYDRLMQIRGSRRKAQLNVTRHDNQSRTRTREEKNKKAYDRKKEKKIEQ